MFYSAITGGFYNPLVHGPKFITILDPDHEGENPPTIAVENPDCKFPPDAVEVSDDDYADLMLKHSLGHSIQSDVTGYPIAVAPPPIDLSLVQANALRIIDEQAEHARLSFITGGAGQAMVYQRKVQEAEQLSTSDDLPENFPLLTAEIGITGDTIQDVAIAILNQRDAWIAVAALIETARLLSKNAVKVCVETDEVQAVLNGITWPTPEQPE